MDNEYEYKRALIFLERKTIVHISKTDGYWFNGLIIEANQQFFVAKDRADGSEKFVYFEELKKSLEPFTEVGK